MKVNSFKLSSSKSQHPLKIQQRTNSSIFNHKQETNNDTSKPIRIFNSQFTSNCVTPQDKYNSNEEIVKEKPLIISNQIKEQILCKPTRYLESKDSFSFTKNKMSEVFTNADSKSYYGKEVEYCHGTGTIDNHNVTDTTFFSLLPHSNCLEKKSDRDKSCNCSQRNSMKLNTQDLIKITNQRKEMLSKMEEIEKKRRSSIDINDIESMQTSFVIEYNNTNENNAGDDHDITNKEIKEQENPIVEDTIIDQKISIEKSIDDKNKVKDKDDNDDYGKDKVKVNDSDDQSGNEVFLNQFENTIQFSLSINTNLPKTTNNVLSSLDEFANFSMSKDPFSQLEQTKPEDNQSKLEFKIENGSNIIRKNNQQDSFCDETEDIIVIQDPFKVTGITLKDEVTEINEIDINRNKLQNETKMIINIEQELKQKSMNNKSIAQLIDPFSCLRNYDKSKVNKPDYSKYITKHKTIDDDSNNNHNENIYNEGITADSQCNRNDDVNADSIKKLNFFEETLRKIPVNQDRVNEEVIVCNANPILKQNDRYEENKKSIIVPQIQLKSKKCLKEIKTADISHDHHRIVSQITPKQTKINEYPTQNNVTRHNMRANSCGRDRSKTNNSPKKKDRKPKKYTDLFLRKIITNEIGNVLNYNHNENINEDKLHNLKNINRSCDGNEVIYNKENLTQRNKMHTNKKSIQSGRNIDLLIEHNKAHIYDTQE